MRPLVWGVPPLLYLSWKSEGGEMKMFHWDSFLQGFQRGRKFGRRLLLPLRNIKERSGRRNNPPNHPLHTHTHTPNTPPPHKKKQPKEREKGGMRKREKLDREKLVAGGNWKVERRGHKKKSRPMPRSGTHTQKFFDSINDVPTNKKAAGNKMADGPRI